jgi:hypothetical protein
MDSSKNIDLSSAGTCDEHIFFNVVDDEIRIRREDTFDTWGTLLGDEQS